jgi:2,4-dienoyl-CoA reductase-like NADH-dependent reductase (Old Yellow Enzyme family)
MKIAGLEFDFERQVGLRTPVEQRPMLFRPITLREVTARNRIMLSPMSQYLAVDGAPTDWHLVHLGQFAMGGAGIVFCEETSVEARGRRTHHCAGIYNDAQLRGWRRVTAFLKDLGAVPAMQLGHAGRRASSRGPFQARAALTEADKANNLAPWQAISSTNNAHLPNRPKPLALDRDGIKQVVQAYKDAARRSLDAGFDILEIHGAHGYLIFQFLSPLANDRTDAYGGDLQGRMRFGLEVTEAVREAWPKSKPLFFRVSAVDGKGGQWDIDDTVTLAKELKARGVDVIDCSSGGTMGDSNMPPVPKGMPGYHVVYADHLRREVGLPTVAVGLITEGAQAEAILREGKADIIGIAREMMCDPYWPVHAAKALGLPDWMELLPPTYTARLQQREQDRQTWTPGGTYEMPFRRKM